MEFHHIELLEDFYGLKSYVQECNYTSPLPDSPSIHRIQGTNYLSTLEFRFEEHETFIIKLPKREEQEEACRWFKSIIPSDNSSLIFGKDKTERIVSIEPKNDTIEIFIEEADGTIRSDIRQHDYWTVGCMRHDENFKKLDGNLFYKFIKKYTDKDEWLDDRRNLKKYKIYSIYDDKESSMVLNGYTYFKGMKVEDVSTLSFDIESIGLDRNSDSKVLLISNTYRKSGNIIKRLFAYDEYKSQGQMIDDWCKWVREINPSIVLGHNIFSFDLPYLSHIADLEGTSLKLGRDGSSIRFNEWESKFRKDGSQFYIYNKCYVYGRELVDTMFLSYKYDIGRKYDRYGLKPIVEHEYNDALYKVEHGEKVSSLYLNLIESQKQRTFYDSSKIRNNYTDKVEWDKIKAYCVDDSDDALFLFDLMIPAFFYLTQSIPKSFQEILCTATGSQINSLLVRSYLQDNHSIPRESDAVPYEGAISFGTPGVYRNLYKIDISSLYPSIVLQYEVYDKFKDPRQNFLKMMTHFTKERLNNKKLAKETGLQYYSDLSEAQKQVVNSGYGFMAAPGLLFNSPSNASFITKKGREILQFAIQWATGKTYEQPKSDT